MNEKQKKCPICGKDNDCRHGEAECWCTTAVFPQGIFELVPTELKGKACICRDCLERYHQRIKGNLVELVPADLKDRRKIYEWGCQSEITKHHAGPPDYSEHPVATWQEFCEDYTEFYFDGSQPEKGRGYLITVNQEPVGFVSYASFHLKRLKTELDIWMNSEANCGKGYGTDAILSLSDHLNHQLGIQEIIMRPSMKNTRAIKAYRKAGFIEADSSVEDYLLEEYLSSYGDGDYGPGGDVILVKRYDK